MSKENNKLIAEFMGVEEAYNPNGNDWVLKTTTPDAYGDTDILESCKDNELQYHCSWDWLMPVAEKCLTTNEPTDGQHYFINDALLTCNIDVVYDRVVEFIKEYNFGESMEEVSIFDFLIHINTQDK